MRRNGHCFLNGTCPDKDMKPIMSKKTYSWIAWLTTVLPVVLIILLVITNVGISTVPSGSMEPTIRVGSLTLYEHVNSDDLEYGNIVLFFPVDDQSIEVSNFLSAHFYNRELGIDPYTKRVVGFAGDVIETHDGYLWRNGEKQIESYVAENTDGNFGPYVVPDGYIFCMGDNRNRSIDSRYYGAFSENVFYGRLVKVLPPMG